MKLEIGQTFINNEGCIGTIVDIKHRNEVYVVFNDYMEPKKCQFGNIKSGEVKNPYHPSVCGVGYLGQGPYKACERKQNGKVQQTKCYEKWQAMLQRCYDAEFHDRYPTYKKCRVCKEWHNFQNFAEWFYNNYYEVPGCKMELDKDILNANNTVYGPDTCVFVPKDINILFEKGSRKRITTGVTTYGKRFRAKLGKIVIGVYDNEYDAWLAYKNFKTHYIIDVISEQYKSYIPHNLYIALKNYNYDMYDN